MITQIAPQGATLVFRTERQESGLYVWNAGQAVFDAYPFQTMGARPSVGSPEPNCKTAQVGRNFELNRA